MNWIYYLLEANFYLAVFYALYYFIFRHETWHQLSRGYLLAGSLLSFIIPFTQLGFLKATPQNTAEIALEPISKTASVHVVAPVLQSQWGANDYALAFYLVIVFVLLVNLTIKITKLINLSRKHKNKVIDTYKLVETTGDQDAFSFFNYLFINPQLASKQTIIHHELIHIRQKHSWDILFLEAIKIINWFNPVVYLLQYSIKELHEFIADSETVKAENNTAAYTDFLVSSACGLGGITLTSTFFNKNLLKRRIIMLHQKKSGKSARLKYLLAIPIFAGLLCLSTLAFPKEYGWITLLPTKDAIIPKENAVPTESGYVIDPESYDSGTLNKIGAKLYKKGYRLEYNDFINDDKKPMLEVAINRLSTIGWNNHTKASATFRVEELKKIGYVIFVGYDETKKELYVRSEKRNSEKTSSNSTNPIEHTAHYKNKFTKKGYKYEETGYLVNNKADFRVIITDKSGKQTSYFKNTAKPAEINMLKEKYGYSFPTMAIFSRMPPPPPAPMTGPPAPGVDKRNPPPPPAPPHKIGAIKAPSAKNKVAEIQIDEPAPPPPPAQIIINDVDTTKAKAKSQPVKTALYQQPQGEGKPIPLIVVNGTPFKLKAKLKPGERIYIDGGDSVAYYSPNDVGAKKKWGADAANGVFDLHGKTEMTIR